MCTTIESATRTEGEKKIYKEERNALKEDMRIDKFECHMEEFGRLERNEERSLK